MKCKAWVIIVPILALLPLSVQAEDNLTPLKIEKQAEDYLSLVNSVKHHTAIVIKKIGVDTDKRDITFNFYRFNTFNESFTCEIVYGTMAYEQKKGVDANKIMITSISQDSTPCKFENTLK
ncbi:hypothetical protein WKH15_21695 [Pantoea agglomerans]|uniref:hypothetical protein n=1 Tax=Enterobacter agglomerans TaxID=549 RepID=UPI003C7CCC49